jgi:hypothetical protein
MTEDSTHLTGWILIAGALTFGVGAGNPYLVRAWTAPHATFLTIVARRPGAWRFSNLLFIAATVLTAAGLQQIAPIMPGGWPATVAAAGSVAFAIAAVLWIVSLVFRLAVTPETAHRFVSGGTPDPSTAPLDLFNGALFKAFIVIGLAGLAAIGLAATAGGPIPDWIGWGTAGLSVLLIAGLAVAGDLPPFTVYLAPLAFGIALVTA